MDTNKLLTALGPLAAPFQDEAVQEIMADAWDRLYVQQDGLLVDLELTFSSPAAFRGMIDEVLALAGTAVSESTTTADIRLPDNSRFRVVVPPTAVEGPYVVINKPFIRGMTWENLLSFGSLDEDAIVIFDSAIQAGASILISGGTSSGKTTLLNMLAGRVPEGKRIVAVEDIHHLKIPHPRAVYLEAQAAQVPMDELIEMGGRMYPGWLVVNEISGPEALKALQLFSTGYSGMGSLHAEDPLDALTRLESYGLMGNQRLTLADIRRLIAGGIQLVVQIQRIPNGKRRVTEMVQVQGLDAGRYLFQPLHRYLPETDSFEALIPSPSWTD